ncbi:MAG: DNA methyltransferase, partial [Terriglobia bacterium]
PYGIKYGSNFQPFVNKREVKDGKDEDLTQEPETLKAFRDTWELGIHSYLAFLRDRLLLARELLHESGSCFVQISDVNVHLVRNLMDEVFGTANFISLITFKKTTGAGSPQIGTNVLPSTNDYLLWYSRDSSRTKYRQLYLPRIGEGWVNYDFVRLSDGTHRKMTAEEKENWSLLRPGSAVYRRDNLTSSSSSGEAAEPFKFEGGLYLPGPGGWKTSKAGLKRLEQQNRLEAYGRTLSYRRFASDFPWFRLINLWDDTASGGYSEDRIYVVQTRIKVLQRCLLMTSDPGDLVFDPTCGSGTTAYVAEQWGRRWITCDTSRVSITLAKQRIMTALFDYYELAHPNEGVGSGFKYKTIPHITLKSIANNEEPGQETLCDQPFVDKNRARVTGPFTVEAVPAPAVKPLSEVEAVPQSADASIARSGPTLRQSDWRDELLKCGIRGKHGQHILFSRVEPLAGT